MSIMTNRRSTRINPKVRSTTVLLLVHKLLRSKRLACLFKLMRKIVDLKNKYRKIFFRVHLTHFKGYWNNFKKLVLWRIEKIWLTKKWMLYPEYCYCSRKCRWRTFNIDIMTVSGISHTSFDCLTYFK